MSTEVFRPTAAGMRPADVPGPAGAAMNTADVRGPAEAAMNTADVRGPEAAMDTEVDLCWETVCRLDRLQPERGVAALLGEVQVAVFRTHDGSVHALGNVDPFSGAAVLSRGIVGDRGGVPTVASPVYKQAFSLLDGRCLDDAAVSVPCYPVRVVDDWLQIGLL